MTTPTRPASELAVLPQRPFPDALAGARFLNVGPPDVRAGTLSLAVNAFRALTTVMPKLNGPLECSHGGVVASLEGLPQDDGTRFALTIRCTTPAAVELFMALIQRLHHQGGGSSMEMALTFAQDKTGALAMVLGIPGDKKPSNSWFGSKAIPVDNRVRMSRPGQVEVCLLARIGPELREQFWGATKHLVSSWGHMPA